MPDTRLSPTAGATETTLAANVYRLLGQSPWQDIHTNAPTSSGTSLTVADSSLYEVGDRIEWPFDATYERAEVTALPNATTLTVRRGVDGSTASAHAANAVIVKNPVFWAPNIQKAINDSVAQDLYPELYAVYETQVAYTPASADWYEIDVVAEEVISAYQKPDTGNVDLVPVSVSQPRYVDATLASTHKKAIKILYAPDNNNTIFVQYLRAPAIADLSAGMVRVVEYGAAMRLLEWQGPAWHQILDKQQTGVVAPGQPIRDARWFEAQLDAAKRKEKAVLNRRFPRKRRRWMPNASMRHYPSRGGGGGQHFYMRHS